MQDFLKTVEMIMIDLWNYLYVLLQLILNGETDGENDFVKDPIED